MNISNPRRVIQIGVDGCCVELTLCKHVKYALFLFEFWEYINNVCGTCNECVGTDVGIKWSTS